MQRSLQRKFAQLPATAASGDGGVDRKIVDALAQFVASAKAWRAVGFGSAGVVWEPWTRRRAVHAARGQTLI